ncbi:MAG: DUF1178 family protein [Alphaproteobacteria bacterium]|nr:DUF1178 family protein [Alphaproteobacteria bacterium]MBM3951594.1 DUF1178 family protein [Rhodospirillales bacterium]
MIRYRLQCPKGHSFDEWFDSGADCDAKLSRKAMACPECGDRKIAKGIMAPSVAGSSRAAEAPACGSGMPCGACPMAGQH